MKVDKELLDKFFNYRCTEQEERKVKAWLSTMENDFKDISSIEQAWFEFEPPGGEGKWDKDLLFTKIDDSINYDIQNKVKVLSINNTPEESEKGFSLNRLFSVGSAIAATLTLLIVFGYFFHLKEEGAKSQNEIASIPILLKENPKGQKATFKLSDGTIVKLNAESSLSFPQKFSGNKRVVELRGEAFFDVQEDKNRPFIIKVGELEAKVLGTSFNINAFPESNEIDIALLTGKLAVNPTKEMKHTSVLLPTERLVFNKDTKKVYKDHFNEDEVMAWRNGVLLFEKADLSELVQRLERWYGCAFEIKEDNLKKQIAYTGRFDNESLEEVLEGLELATGLKFKLKNKKVMLLN